MHVRVSETARKDLLDIARYIATDNPKRAVSFTDQPEQACFELAEHALRYALVPRYEQLGYRRRPFGRYAILYSVSAPTVLIVRVVSSSMDLANVLAAD